MAVNSTKSPPGKVKIPKQSRVSRPVRRRISRACDRCKVKKTKCGGGSPCEKCRENGSVCQFSIKRSRDSKSYYLRMHDIYDEALHILFNICSEHDVLPKDVPTKIRSCDKVKTSEILEMLSLVEPSDLEGERYSAVEEFMLPSKQRQVPDDVDGTLPAQPGLQDGVSNNYIQSANALPADTTEESSPGSSQSYTSDEALCGSGSPASSASQVRPTDVLQSTKSLRPERYQATELHPPMAGFQHHSLRSVEQRWSNVPNLVMTANFEDGSLGYPIPASTELRQNPALHFPPSAGWSAFDSVSEDLELFSTAFGASVESRDMQWEGGF